MTRTHSLFLAGLTVAACTIPPADVLEPTPTITGFSASATEVAPGTAVTLSWATSNATSLRLDEAVGGRAVSLSAPDAGASDGGAVDAGLPSSVVVTIDNTSLFVLTATNARGASTSASVTVKASGGSSQLFFVAAPALIHSGETATLVWNTPGASQVSVTAEPGGAVPVDQSSAGSTTVTPEVPTTYTLTAGGTSRTLSLPVLPTVDSFTATAQGATPDAGAVDGGARVHLTWATRGARSVRVKVDGRQVVTLTSAADVAAGAYDDLLPTPDPSRVYVYELTAANDAGVELSTASFPE